MKYNIEQRKELARQLRKQGLNCCQCVAMAFDDVTGMDHETIKRLAEGFGSGFGGSQEICGTVSGATMVCGPAYPELDRKGVYGKVKELMDKFGRLEGSCVCRELKKPGRKPCLELITDMVGLVHTRLESDGK